MMVRLGHLGHPWRASSTTVTKLLLLCTSEYLHALVNLQYHYPQRLFMYIYFIIIIIIMVRLGHLGHPWRASSTTVTKLLLLCTSENLHALVNLQYHYPQRLFMYIYFIIIIIIMVRLGHLGHPWRASSTTVTKLLLLCPSEY